MLARMLGAARLNVHTFEDVEADKGATMQAMIVVVLVCKSMLSFLVARTKQTAYRTD